MKKIQDADVTGKKVLVRVDFNVAIENGKAKENFKIKACQETVKYLLERNAKVALVSHLGRPASTRSHRGEPNGTANLEFSLEQLRDETEELLGTKIKFISDCIGEKVAEGLNNLAAGEVLLLENVRFYAGEEENDENFGKLLAENFDIFINDAFSVCHRDQASVTGVAKIIPSYAGLWLQKEIENLDKIKNNPEHPAVAIIGGAKIETKLPLIAQFEKNYDYILVGGIIANEAMDQKLQFSEKVILPLDLAKDRFDIGPKTMEKFSEIIKTAKTIVWNGPMGKFEEKPYDAGTQGILKAVLEKTSHVLFGHPMSKDKAFVLMGGGESVEILEEQNAMDKISFVSTGGGAMLEYLSGNPMPGIEALNS